MPASLALLDSRLELLMETLLAVLAHPVIVVLGCVSLEPGLWTVFKAAIVASPAERTVARVLAFLALTLLAAPPLLPIGVPPADTLLHRKQAHVTSHVLCK